MSRPYRCNYCEKPPTVLMQWVVAQRSRGLLRAVTVTAAACDEHEGCPNWESNRAHYPDAKITRLTGAR